MMQPNPLLATTLILLSALSSALLGGAVFFSNPWRRTHRRFALLTANLSLWALGVLAVIHSHSPLMASFWIRMTFVVASFLPAVFYHFIVIFPYQRFEGNRWVLRFLYGGAVFLSLGAFSPWYIDHVELFADHPPLVRYGPIFFGYGVVAGVALVFSLSNLIRKVRQSIGIQRRQIEHVLTNFLVVSLLALSTNVLAPALRLGTLEVYGPCFVMLMVAGLAYSMLRYHLLDIWVIFSRTTVYAVVTGFVIATFLVVVSGMHWFVSTGGRGGNLITTALAALVVVLVIQPLKERVQLLLDRVVLHRRYDSKAFIERISRNAARFVQLDQLLERTIEDIRHTIGARNVRVLLASEKEPGVLMTEYSTRPEEIGKRDINLDFLLRYLEKHPEPLVLEEIVHGRPTRDSMRLAKHLAEMDAWLVAPLKTTAGVLGMIVVGEKNTHDIYIHEDVEVFATIAAALATAIENARLYRKLKEVNLHLERIMSSMRGGVVAVDNAGVITTVNEEAKEMLGNIRPGMTVDALEPKTAELLRYTLRERRSIGDVETVITGPDGENIPVAMASSYFDAPEDELRGATVLIYNMTQIKRLESNMQRAERLSAIGIMAAGMAHEIKNPLQSIKTFTQLLPHRFEDADFRRTFNEVVPPEVQRIDTIVSRLLDFARPKPVRFAPHDLRRIIQEVLALTDNQIKKAQVEVFTDFPDIYHPVHGDEQHLHQVFLNLVLNAITAMEGAAQRRLSIRMDYVRTHLARKGKAALFDAPCVRVVVADTGCGIRAEDMDQLFMPFFTTKTDGSGLGLSVVHGIVMEHGGEIDVSSVVNVGTTVTVTLPLMPHTEAVERVST